MDRNHSLNNKISYQAHMHNFKISICYRSSFFLFTHHKRDISHFSWCSRCVSPLSQGLMPKTSGNNLSLLNKTHLENRSPFLTCAIYVVWNCLETGPILVVFFSASGKEMRHLCGIFWLGWFMDVGRYEGVAPSMWAFPAWFWRMSGSCAVYAPKRQLDVEEKLWVQNQRRRLQNINQF